MPIESPNIVEIYSTDTDKSKAQAKKDAEKTKEEPSSMFQRQRVDMLLGELLRKFPPPILNTNPVPPAPETAAQAPAAATQENATSNKQNSENSDFKPPEKRAK